MRESVNQQQLPSSQSYKYSMSVSHVARLDNSQTHAGESGWDNELRPFQQHTVVKQFEGWPTMCSKYSDALVDMI